MKGKTAAMYTYTIIHSGVMPKRLRLHKKGKNSIEGISLRVSQSKLGRAFFIQRNVKHGTDKDTGRPSKGQHLRGC